MKKILIILTGVLLVYSEPVLANNEITGIAIAKKVTKMSKKTSQKKKKVNSAKKKATKKKVIKKKVVKKTKKKTYKQTTRVRYNVGEIQSYAHSLVLSYGWSESDYQALVHIVYKESSWNPNAINKKSGACGLFQAYPCSKMAKYGNDYRTNYKTQMKFGFEYIKARYQTPTKAWAFWQSHHWY